MPLCVFRFRHRNLVDLVGFCFDPPMLVYEFMEQGNLADRLCDSVSLCYIVIVLFASYIYNC